MAFVTVAVKVTVQAGWQSPDEITTTVGGQGAVVNTRSAPPVWPPAFVPTTRKWQTVPLLRSATPWFTANALDNEGTFCSLAEEP